MGTEPTTDAPAAASKQAAQELRNLIRLGWAVAEVRGLVDLIARGPSDQWRLTETGGPDNEGQRGPLATDDVRSVADRLGWASKNLNALVSRIRQEPARTQTTDDLPEPPGRIRDVSGGLKSAIEYDGQVPIWRKLFVEELVIWDQQVRSNLSSWGRRERSAYLFGRELAETYWCLNVRAEDSEPDSWSTLFSKDRVTRLGAELRQLGGAVDARRARCLQASLSSWKDFVAAGKHRKAADAAKCLDGQVQVWQSLLDADTDLDGLRPPASFLRGVWAGMAVVRVMWAQLAVLTGFTVLLAWGAWLLTNKQQHGFLSAFVAAVGAIGVTGAALTTKAKAEAINLIENINAAVDSALDAAATTVVPQSPPAKLRRRLSLVGARTELSVVVYPALPAPSGNGSSQSGRAGPAALTTQAPPDGGSSNPPEPFSPTVT